MTDSNTATPGRRALVAGYAATAADLTLVALGLLSMVASAVYFTVVWEIAAVAYMASAWYVSRRMTYRGASDSRTGVFRWLSWLMPLAASAAGVNAALVALVGKSIGEDGIEKFALTAIGVAGIVIAWGLINTSFVNVYMSILDRSDPDRPPFHVPGTPDPDYPEMIYFSFTIGTSFAASDVDVLTRRARRAVLAHSVVAFFFNALVVAAAFQAMQQLTSI